MSLATMKTIKNIQKNHSNIKEMKMVDNKTIPICKGIMLLENNHLTPNITLTNKYFSPEEYA